MLPFWKWLKRMKSRPLFLLLPFLGTMTLCSCPLVGTVKNHTDCDPLNIYSVSGLPDGPAVVQWTPSNGSFDFALGVGTSGGASMGSALLSQAVGPQTTTVNIDQSVANTAMKGDGVFVVRISAILNGFVGTCDTKYYVNFKQPTPTATLPPPPPQSNPPQPKPGPTCHYPADCFKQGCENTSSPSWQKQCGTVSLPISRG